MDGDWAPPSFGRRRVASRAMMGGCYLNGRCGVMSCGVCGWVLLGRACMLVYNNKIIEFRDLPVIVMSARVRSYVDGRAL